MAGGLLRRGFSSGMVRAMLARTLVVLFLVAGFAAGAEPLPPAAAMTEAQLAQRADLFAELAASKDDAQARAVEEKIWTFWRSFADAESQVLLAQARAAQLRFDYDEALLYLKEVVRRQPDFAEGWNQLGFNYFLTNRYDESLAAIEHVIALEPMHYAALAGKGIILIQQGKEDEAQAPLKRALAIDPWLKERNLIGKTPEPRP